MAIISASVIVAKIIACSEMLIKIPSQVPDKVEAMKTIALLTQQLNTSHIIFWLLLLLFLPFCILFTRSNETFFYGKRTNTIKKFLAIFFTILLYLMALGIDFYFLFVF